MQSIDGSARSRGSSGQGLVGVLNRDLAIQDGLAIELMDGALCLGGRRHVNERVSNRAGSVRVSRDVSVLTGYESQSQALLLTSEL